MRSFCTAKIIQFFGKDNGLFFDFGTSFAIDGLSAPHKHNDAVRFLHLFKFGLVVLGGQPPKAAGNRDDSLPFFFDAVPANNVQMRFR